MVYEILQYNELDTWNLDSKIQKALKILKSGDWDQLDVKKFKNQDIYRAKLDYSNRILFKIGEYQKKKYLLLLEVIHNHNYNKSRFLRGAKIRDDDFEVTHQPEKTQPLSYVNTAQGRFQILDKFLCFDEGQDQIFNLPFPLIVVGPAGSGKTALILEKMKMLTGQGLYVTHSKFLVESSRKTYYSHHYENNAQEVEFFSFKEFLQSIEVPNGKEINFERFHHWWNRQKTNFPIKESAHKIFEEFKGVITGTSLTGPFLSKEDYLSLGVKQSIFNPKDRVTIYDLFQKYLLFLEKNQFFDQNIISFNYLKKARPFYDFLVIDEVQDFTTIQLKLLFSHLKGPERWLMCGDSNQIVHPNFFSWSRIKTMLYQEKANSSQEVIRVLNNNFRNSKTVTDFANSVLVLKNKRFGSIDKETNFLVTSKSSEQGLISRVQKNEKILHHLNTKCSKSTKVAIIIPNEALKEEAIKYFKSPLIFTIREAKGLEYENIILFDFISHYSCEFDDICEGIDSISLDEQIKYSRAKNKSEKSLEAYKFFINSFYVATTRAIKNLIIIEARNTHRFYDLLNYPSSEPEFTLDLKESNLDDWREEAKRLEMQGKAEQADKIHKLILGDKRPVPWKLMTEKRFKDLSFIISNRKIKNLDKKERAYPYHFSLLHSFSLWKKKMEQFQGKEKSQIEAKTLHNKYYLDYLGKNFTNLEKQIENYGVDFLNPFGLTPLQMASYLGVPLLVKSLIKSNAKTSFKDLWGRSALGLAIWKASKEEKYKKGPLSEIYQELSKHPYRFQSLKKLQKIGQRAFEYFLFHLLYAHYYNGHISGQAKDEDFYTFNSIKLEEILSTYPDSVISPLRKKKKYLSSILSKNEVKREHLYNRGLFLRVKRGQYLLNLDLSFELEEDTWVRLYDLLRISSIQGLLSDLWDKHKSSSQD